MIIHHISRAGRLVALALMTVAVPTALAVEPPPSADFNRDHVVDRLDLQMWCNGFGGPNADADNNGVADGNDFLSWQRQLGQSSPPADDPGNPPLHNPEPATLLVWSGLAGIAGLAFAAKRRRAARHVVG